MATDLVQLYLAYPEGDAWVDSDIQEALYYVRASKKLRLPDIWREVLPKYIPNISIDSESDGEVANSLVLFWVASSFFDFGGHPKNPGPVRET